MGEIRAFGVFRFQYYGQRERRILEVTSAICLAGERLFRGTVLLAYVAPTNAAIETGAVGGKILREEFEPLKGYPCGRGGKGPRSLKRNSLACRSVSGEE